ncbi:DUF3014 domain-containing protein [Alteromonas pelagimontana]|uniref:DUF3014 domain-containing protein n=1 Tax=Alteromonas pelagimontana TaxID=1858656 RepID=A0A6M4MCR7_9ALTE|nr:DUF3014 domain-containing protein [Alteromonas pelagimontana]QJR80902.1 DUF3014 domain-containing protein [Alteromonas pelagimontana]
MSENSEKRTIAPHIVIIVAVIVVIIAVLLWPTSDEPDVTKPDNSAVIEEEPMAPNEPEAFAPTPTPEPVEIDPNAEVEPMPQTPQTDPEPLDTSDEAIKTSLDDISESEQVNRLLINEGLLQRFVVSVTNVANEEVAGNLQPVKAPEQSFRVYSQADKQWIDAASYKRYTPYVEMLESFENDALLGLFNKYEGQIQSKYAEIGDPDKPFNEVMVEAIDQLLNTPEVPVPVEVYSDSVAYKYTDPQLENLSGPQKQLLRTGPDNMRRIKAKLRELKDLLQADGSE